MAESRSSWCSGSMGCAEPGPRVGRGERRVLPDRSDALLVGHERGLAIVRWGEEDVRHALRLSRDERGIRLGAEVADDHGPRGWKARQVALPQQRRDVHDTVAVRMDLALTRWRHHLAAPHEDQVAGSDLHRRVTRWVAGARDEVDPRSSAFALRGFAVRASE